MNTISTSIRLNFATGEADAIRLLDRLFRMQQAAKRQAYQHLAEGKDEADIWNTLRVTFPLLTGRNVNDALTMAKAIRASQQALLPEQINGLGRRMARSKQLLEREKKRKTGARVERVRRIEHRLQDLIEQQKTLQAHLNAGTLPAAVFGGRKRWQKVQGRVAGAKEDWWSARTREFVTVGAKNQKGNPHCRLRLTSNGQLQLAVRVPTRTALRGERQTTLARWLTFPVDYSRAYESLLRDAAEQGDKKQAAYTLRVLRLTPGKYRAYVTVSEPVAHREYGPREPLPEWCKTMVGIDLNLDHVALMLTDRQGQFLRWQVFKFPNLGELPRNISNGRVGEIAREVVQWAKAQNAQAVVMEALDIEPEGGRARFNRRTIPFCYRQLITAIGRAALRAGLAVKRINPAYTSWIGKLKYAWPYGVSVHVSAAYVTARRGLGLQERLPAQLIRQFPALIAKLKQEIVALEQKAKDKKEDVTRKALAQRREWVKRLENWKEFSPESGRPWLLWVTLKQMKYQCSQGGLGSMTVKTTEGRNDPAWREHSADNIRLAVVPG